MPKGIPLTDKDQNRRRHEIFGAAVQLFLKHGFQETSLREIAEKAGIGKSTLYDYFQTKEDILAWGIEDSILDATEEVREIAALPMPAIERLRKATQNHAEMLASRRDFYVRLSFEVQRLSLKTQERIQAGRHAYQDVIRQMIEDGIKEGSIRPVDSLFVARMLILAVTPTVLTTRPSGTPHEMLDTAFDVILRGIQA